MPAADAPALVTLHRWQVPGHRVPGAVARMATHRSRTAASWRRAAAEERRVDLRPLSSHRQAIRRTAQEQWYAEDLFARFAVLRSAGTYGGRDPVA